MIFSRLHRRLAALAAVLAIALQALWPLIAQAKPRVPGELVPICTINGITHYLELPAVKTPLEQRSSSHDEHCKLCFFATERAILTEDIVVPPVVKGFAEVKTATAILRLESQHYPQARPRAPPVGL